MILVKEIKIKISYLISESVHAVAETVIFSLFTKKEKMTIRHKKDSC